MTNWKEWVQSHLDLGELVDPDAADIVAEIAQMHEDHFEDLRASGTSVEDADTATRDHVQDWDALRADVTRTLRSRRKSSAARVVESVESRGLAGGGWGHITETVKDIHLALRSLRLSPMSSLVMILTLGLGIGVTTAIYSVVEAVVLRPLPYPEADRLGVLTFTGQGLNDSISVTPSNVLDFTEQARSLETLGTYSSFSNTLALEDDSLVFVTIGMIEPQLAGLLGITPSRGRIPEPAIVVDGQEARSSEGMISEETWERHFANDPEILGRLIEVAGNDVIIVGIAPRGTRFLVHPEGERERIDIWLPRAPLFRRGNVFSQRVLVRVAAGTSFEEASVEINAIVERNRDLDFENEDGRGVYAVVPLRDRLVQGVRPILYLLLGAVGFVLLLVCVNVANLLLVRSLRRRQEWALRAALGASRGRIVRLGLTESMVLAVFGGLFGTAVAAGCLELLPLVMPGTLPRGTGIGINGAVLVFAAAVSLGTSLLFGLVPAWNASRVDLQDALKEGGRTVAEGGGRVSRALITAQFALALVLVVGSGLMLRTVVNLNSVDVGFEVDGLLTFEALLPGHMWQEPALRLQFYREAVERLEAMPGVSSASWTNIVPLSGGFNTASWAYDEESIERFGELTAYFRRATPGYFRTVGMPIVAGRDFNSDDVDNDRYVLIVSEGMAELAWPNESPIGKRVSIDFATPSGMTELRETEVIGMVPTSRELTLHGDEPPTAYLPAWSTRAVNRALVRTSGDPTALVPAVRELVKELGIRRPLDNVRAVRRNIDDATEDTRFVLTLTGVFSGLAVLLAALGIYGVVSHLVGQRQHEIGVRMALGASRTSVRSMVMRQGLAVVAVGLGVGMALAWGVTRLIGSMLYGVSPTDPVTFAAVTGLLLAVAALACLIPATRATRVEPVTALRDAG
jgi:putative ABC transport system permease protein